MNKREKMKMSAANLQLKVNDDFADHAKNCQPVNKWLGLINGTEASDPQETLRQIYRDNFPTQGELIFTGACEFECAHCIYPPDYSKLNGKLSVSQWEDLIDQMVDGLGIQTFVYGGRSLTRQGVTFLQTLRKKVPNAHIGMIDNGISINKWRDQIADLQLDWIDISLDGQSRDHNLQRNKAGSYEMALEGALWLKDQLIAPKVNILTCLTTININSVIPMIREVNALGFKNFFVTPVTIVDDLRPHADLMLSGNEFTGFIRELEEAVPGLDDAWVEMNIFVAEYMKFIGDGYPELWKKIVPQRDSLAMEIPSGNNVLNFNYYPSSLTGIREFIVNTNGDVIFPKSMARGKIIDKDIAGSMLDKNALNIVRKLPESEQFQFYWKEFMEERKLFASLEVN